MQKDALQPLSMWGQYVGMTELSGPLLSDAERIPRYQKVRFVCHACGQLAEDFAVGFVVSSEIDPKTQKRSFLVKGHLTASCAFQYVQENQYQFSEQMQELYTLMLMEAYGATHETLRSIIKAPPRWQISQYLTNDSKMERLSGIEFHKRYALNGMKAPDPSKVQILETRSTLLLEAVSLQSMQTCTLSEMKTMFPTLYFQPNTKMPDNQQNAIIKGFSMFSVMNAQLKEEEEHKRSLIPNTKKPGLEAFLTPLPK